MRSSTRTPTHAIHRTVRIMLMVLVLPWIVSSARSQVPGWSIDSLQLDEMARTRATNLAEYRGRLLLVECFAYW